ncbi:MAG: hypothetical protein FJ077_09195 [Cyanobacteria bacterium K_DeepCast_35m_m2_023]|nr:hypothetical protein [Cyanobacteria bacterium K_DeepCast_35m_m2_023]
MHPAYAHGEAGGAIELEPGAFKLNPVLTIEAHGGLENNVPGQPRHYAIDGLIGAAFGWGLDNGGSLDIEASIGPALVWGEAEHFYGRVHVHSASQEKMESHPEDDHAHEHAGGHDEAESEKHADHSHDEGLATSLTDTPFRRSDVKGLLQVRYAPNPRLAFLAQWKPYWVTKSQGDDIAGVKNELSFGLNWALGDGDLNFALGDGIESLADGLFVSVVNRSGWESDGVFIGNYTDPWLGLGFNVDLLNVTVSLGPRYYVPGSYAGMPNRVDWGGEIELAYPIGPKAVLFAHWRPIYSTAAGEVWGMGWNQHVGSGVTFRF